MELSPSWEAANCAATQEVSSILWNPPVNNNNNNNNNNSILRNLHEEGKE
jgi:hypothetical protein